MVAWRRIIPRSGSRQTDCDAERLARFDRDAEAVAQLSHPNIVAIWTTRDLRRRVVAAELEKILAVGLAKSVGDALAPGTAVAQNSATKIAVGTTPGVVMGTVGYMAAGQRLTRPSIRPSRHP